MASNKQTMKYKITFSFLALSLILVSCKKDLTCDCTTTNSSAGTYYDLGGDQWSGYYQITIPLDVFTSSNSDKTTYSGAGKRAVSENCPVETVSTQEEDETYLSGYFATNGLPIIEGYKTITTVTRTCELEKE